MSSLTNVNNNAAVVVVGRTAPVPPGQQIASKSLPVVIASDQPAIPVEEQNKIASEVALSLLGIPRSEVALGIFADVNTYDVNPSEWASTPEQRDGYSASSDKAYDGFNGTQNHGLQHIPEESGALIEAPANKTATLTSKRFFRYQPGRVSAATFGVKTSVVPNASSSKHVRNPCVRKYGIFDNFDGYYWETRDTGTGDFLSVVRRTQSIIESNPLTFGSEQTEDFGTAGNPSTSTAGDLCILRDGLIHTHAAMYDPSLLLEETEYEFTGVSTGTITVASTSGLNEGQHVIYETQETSALGNLLHSRIYKILNLTGTTFELTELDNDTKIVVGSLSGTHIIKTPAPFVFPDTSNNAGAEDVMFPYKRSFSNEFAVLGTPVGAIATDTSDAYAHSGFDGDGDSNAAVIQEIKKVNSGVSCALLPVNGTASHDTSGWENFVEWNVKPEFYKVYEYRIPRSRFSGDFVDGNEDRDVYYSDVVRTGGGDDTIKYPGQNVKTVADPDANEIRDSIWNLDFTKVLMQKIEFSWYGAVGALFLAYVPVSNGEARWVRIHHLRASNQLKVASLGNATLPITYTVYGGGSTNMYGYDNASRQQNSIPGSGSYSQYITKYGASYYIDGGDRGTVRLHSYSTESASDVYGSKYSSSNWTKGTTNGYAHIEISGTNIASDGFPAISDYYMKSRVVSNNPADRGVFVEWVIPNSSNDGGKLILNKPLVGTGGIGVIADRPQLVFGLQTKQNIISSQNQAVRNRVQVYPTRLATGVSGSGTVSLQLLKNPTFQSYDVDDWSGDLTIHGTDIAIQPAGQPTTLTTTATPTGLTAGDRIYGWFRSHYDSSVDANETLFPVLGYVTVLASGFTFTSLESFSSTVYIDASETFLYAGNYDEDGTALALANAVSTFEIERLSSVVVNPELRTPIPGTGTQVTTFFVGAGGQQFDLLPYFDYNKDYLSFPLTNEVDTLFLASSSVAAYNSGSAEASVLASLTWEEQ